MNKVIYYSKIDNKYIGIVELFGIVNRKGEYTLLLASPEKRSFEKLERAIKGIYQYEPVKLNLPYTFTLSLLPIFEDENEFQELIEHVEKYLEWYYEKESSKNTTKL